MAKSVLFLVPYPIGKAPSQRFRVEQFLPILENAGIRFKVTTFLDAATGKIIYQPGHTFRKALGIAAGFLRRLRTVFLEAPSYDYIFIHREASPIGPPLFEWLLKKFFQKKIIFDFDDAIWIPNTSKENAIADKLKAFWKTESICKWSYKVAAGNAFLKSFAEKYAQQVIVLPTCVNMQLRYNKIKTHEKRKPVVGWTGSHSTLHYVDAILPIIKRLQQQLDFTFLVIADKKPELALHDFRFIPWNSNTEIDDLLQMDIGVMPLKADAWSEGKCGFKLIQYLALGIPAIADPVGVNKEIIEHGTNGFLAEKTSDWEQLLKTLIEDATLRKKLGENGREKMKNQFSIQSQAQTFLALFS